MNFAFEVVALLVVPVIQLDFMNHEDLGEIDILSLRSSWFIVLLLG